MINDSYFIRYDLPIEDIEILGNYQNIDLYEITSYYIPPYDLTVDKDKVPEINLEEPDKDKFFYIDFNIK